jgi:hypothetical protein
MPTHAPINWIADFGEYWTDAVQRAVLFTDILRKRGNIYLDHLADDQPPVLVFDYDMVMDGRTFERPANYALVRIIDRRCTPSPDNGEANRDAAGRRHRTSVATEAPEATSRPIVIFDPRAGHGPGIGGSKRDSQIGMALDAGHPVYFLIFFTTPCPARPWPMCAMPRSVLEKVRDCIPERPSRRLSATARGAGRPPWSARNGLIW